MQLITFIIYVMVGIILWTFAEYILHRFLGHEHKGKNFFKKEHSVHHSKANYFAPFYKKAIAALVASAFLVLVLSLMISLPTAVAFTSGFTGMYLMYELTHFRYHSAEPLAMPFIVLRKHHFYHHFHNPKKNHGVTTRFWDRVFGTFVKVESVKVPKQMSMHWLVENDEIKHAYVTHFQLSKR